MNTVLVTGANGHLGYTLTRLLIERGYKVRASVRDKNDLRKTAHLKPMGVELVEADITSPESLKHAMRGVDGVFQVAAVYNVTAKNPKKEVQDPTIEGALNVLRAAKEANVRRVVFTSSATAVGTVTPGSSPLNEASWNSRVVEPYAQAKTQSEIMAWELAKANGLDMISILPGTMIGPGFYRHTPSTLAFELLLRGLIPVALPLVFDFVDVRDVALAHILAYEKQSTSGRYLASNTSLSLMQLFQLIQEVEPGTKIPNRLLPRSMLGMVPFLDWVGNKTSNTPRFASCAFIKEYGGREQRFSNKRIRTDLDWQPQPIKQSVRDTVDWVKHHFLSGNSMDKSVTAVRGSR